MRVKASGALWCIRAIIESRANHQAMDSVRGRLTKLGLMPYEALSPVLLDAIATHVAKQKGMLVSLGS